MNRWEEYPTDRRSICILFILMEENRIVIIEKVFHDLNFAIDWLLEELHGDFSKSVIDTFLTENGQAMGRTEGEHDCPIFVRKSSHPFKDPQKTSDDFTRKIFHLQRDLHTSTQQINGKQGNRKGSRFVQNILKRWAREKSLEVLDAGIEERTACYEWNRLSKGYI